MLSILKFRELLNKCQTLNVNADYELTDQPNLVEVYINELECNDDKLDILCNIFNDVDCDKSKCTGSEAIITVMLDENMF